MAENKMKPVLKWAGGKTQLLGQIKEKMPEEYNNYFEPFIGGAAVLLGIAPQNASINDTNGQLINLYAQLKTDPESVIRIINELDADACTREIYDASREKYNKKITEGELDAECAALMVWINKHCFNGLYRVNKKGIFNVPYNNKAHGKSIDVNNVRAVAKYLQDADVAITCQDFEAACQGVGPGDFVYFDSPYIPESETASFTKYTTDGFTADDHERLAGMFRRLDGIGAKLMLSNNDVPMVWELYKGFRIQPLNAKRMINRDGKKRSGREVLVTNY